VTSSKDPLYFVSSYTYSSSNGAPASATDPLSRTTRFQTDLLSRVITSTDAAGQARSINTTRPGHDSDDGRDGNVTSFSYEAGRTSVLLSTVTDAKSHATTFAYDIIGRVTERWPMR